MRGDERIRTAEQGLGNSYTYEPVAADHLCHLGHGADAFCGYPRPWEPCGGVYRGEAICPTCGRPTCPRCAALTALEGAWEASKC